MEKEIILKAESISKSFGGVKALQNVSFELQKGEVLSVIGENGLVSQPDENCSRSTEKR